MCIVAEVYCSAVSLHPVLYPSMQMWSPVYQGESHDSVSHHILLYPSVPTEEWPSHKLTASILWIQSGSKCKMPLK